MGWVLPLEEVLANVRRYAPGVVLRVTLKHENDDSWIYSLRVLSPEGRYRDMTVDARNGELLHIRGR